MKAALIPPIPMLQTYGSGNFHLLLSHLMENSHYSTWYGQQRANGAYLVLDNSAHEFKVGQPADGLRDQALFLKAQEVVVPDKLFDADKTVDLAIETLEYWYEKGDERMQDLNPALMYVPQGGTEMQWVSCVRELVRIHVFMTKRVKGFRRSFVLGISKDYDAEWDGGILPLLRDYIAPLRAALWAEKEIKMNVHMLGWMRDLWTLAEVAKEFPWVRSTDSAKPFVYALNEVTLNTDFPPPPYPTRPHDYFSRILTGTEKSRATRNVKVFQNIAKGALS